MGTGTIVARDDPLPELGFFKEDAHGRAGGLGAESVDEVRRVRRLVSALLLLGAAALWAVPSASAQYCSFGPGMGFYGGVFGTPVYGDLPYAYYPYYPLQSYGSYYPAYGAPLTTGFNGLGGSGQIGYGGPGVYPVAPFTGAGYYPYPAGLGYGTALPLTQASGGGGYIGNGLPVGFGGAGFGLRPGLGVGGGYPSSFSTVGFGGYAC